MTNYSLVARLGLLVVLASVTSCLVVPQNPAEIFSDPKDWPSALEELANPKLSQKHLQILEGKSEGVQRIGVAVVDEGVDYTHPKLFKQIRFDRQGSQITGAGYDFMGRDGWAHPNLIDPTLYALTAKSIENGRLVGATGNPLEWIMAAQQRFGQDLVARIQNEPKLAGTWVAKKFNADSLLFLFAPAFIKELEAAKKRYDELAAQNLLINEKSLENPKHLEKYARRYLEPIVRETWIAGEGGTPTDRFPYFQYIEKTQELIPLLKAAVQQVEAQEGAAARLDRYRAYTNILQNQSSGADTTPIATAWLNQRFDYLYQIPIVTFIDNVCKQLTADEKKTIQAADEAARIALTQKALDRKFGIFKKVFEVAAASELYTEDERFESKLAAEAMPTTPKMFAELFKKRPYLARYLNCPASLDLMEVKDPAMAAFARQRKHPLVYSSSEGASHGTHVSGIIVKQSRAIDIVPVRVVTASSARVASVSEGIRARFEQGFAQWIGQPDVAAAMQTALKTKLSGTKYVDKSVAAEMKPYLDETFSGSYLDFQFFDQILEAVTYVGSRKLKVANLSLGTSFEKAIFDPSPANHEARFKSFMNFAVYEYFKYAVAKTIEEKAKGTLFVIASGNDSAWVDGKSRSALPCDLGSPTIEAGQVGKPESAIVPNNRVKNILCVGSIDENGDLSAFMNLPVGRVPFVLSYGEAVLAPIKITDCDGTSQGVNDDYGKAAYMPMLSVGDEGEIAIYDELFKELGLLDPKSEDSLEDQRLTASSQLWMDLRYASTYSREALVQSRCMTNQQPLARMSGTSMATPAVAGFVAKQLVAIANSKGLTEAALYDAPDYTPEKLIALVREKSPAFGGNTILKDISKVVDISKWQKQQQQLKLQQVIGVMKLGDVIPKPTLDTLDNTIK